MVERSYLASLSKPAMYILDVVKSFSSLDSALSVLFTQHEPLRLTQRDHQQVRDIATIVDTISGHHQWRVQDFG